jgi:hypothetical protein
MLKKIFSGTLFILILNKGMGIIFMLEKEIDEMTVIFFKIPFLKADPFFL